MSDSAIVATSDGLTSRDRSELAKLVRQRERVAKSASKQRAAELTADVERQLAEIFEADNTLWKHITVAANAAIKAADEEIARVCQEHGIAEQFRPSLHLGWSGRGANASASRRAELRKVAMTRIAALEQTAKTEIERRSVDVQTKLMIGGLQTDAARQFVESMPTADQLMPMIDLTELDKAVPISAGARYSPQMDDIYARLNGDD